jgi:Rab-GTPase-TBC domain
LKETDIPNQDDIRKDVNRTFPDHAFFAERDGYGQQALTRVLKALSASQRDMGYCQGLNYICGLLVLYCNDEVNLKEYRVIV